MPSQISWKMLFDEGINEELCEEIVQFALQSYDKIDELKDPQIPT